MPSCLTAENSWEFFFENLEDIFVYLTAYPQKIKHWDDEKMGMISRNKHLLHQTVEIVKA